MVNSIIEDELIKKISPKTKCIFLVNVHGNSCDLFKVKKIAKKIIPKISPLAKA